MNKVAKDVSTIVADVSAENWEQLLTDAMAAYQDVLATVTACEGSSAEQLYDDLIDAILHEVTLPSGANPAKCEADLDAMFPDF